MVLLYYDAALIWPEVIKRRKECRQVFSMNQRRITAFSEGKIFKVASV